MNKLLLILGFVLAISTLGFAAANAGVPSAPGYVTIDGQTLPVDYD
ncbi:MAG: hypothetical protein ACTHOR_05975 [Devosia sp.]|jgi:hypothetical protein|nr:hypothetical protein [Devosiaceae bacterium]